MIKDVIERLIAENGHLKRISLKSGLPRDRIFPEDESPEI